MDWIDFPERLRQHLRGKKETLWFQAHEPQGR
jgi:hypothetical protein